MFIFTYYHLIIFPDYRFVRNIVDETGMPLPGVNIVQNTNNGTNSDFDGNFTLKGVPVVS